jgi:hypothetical protein
LEVHDENKRPFFPLVMGIDLVSCLLAAVFGAR